MRVFFAQCDFKTMASLGSILGARIAVTTDAGDAFEGDLFAYDEKSHTVVLATQDKHDQQHATLRMLRETSIKDLQVRPSQCTVSVSLLHLSACQYIGVGTTTVLPKGPLPAINEKELHAREKHTMKLAQRQASNTNGQVPVPVQTLFDRISGSYVYSWRERVRA